jgi:signal transduction histidine kinase/ActR/RegA family two-component response regulator
MDIDIETSRRALRAQVASLYATSWSSTLAGYIVIVAVTSLFYWRLHDPMALAWLGLHTVQLLRYPATSAYHRDPDAANRSAFWARRQCRELLIYSSIWGLAPWMFMPADDLPMTALMMLVIMGMSSGGVAAVAPRWASVLSFVVPMVVGLISAMVLRTDGVHLFLAACSAVYLGATLHFARQQHRLLNDALLMRFEKEALAEQLAQQVAAVERASEEKNRFFAAASHDLRQPLHAIALFGAVLEKDLQGRPEHTHATRLMRAVHALGASLDTMLDVSRLDAGVIVPQIQAVPINPLFQSVNQLFATSAEEKGLQLRLRASPLAVRSDPVLLLRLLSNLVENAIKYTSRGGVLVVARARGDQVWIDVCDTGIGVAPEHIEHIFEEFYQGNNPGRDRSQGLGIGLSIVQRLSTLLNHPVLVHSQADRGTRFRVVAPTIMARQSRPVPPTLQPRSDGPSLLPLALASPLPQRMLLIDDEIDIGDAIAALMGSYGVDLHVARDEVAAVSAFLQATVLSQPFEALICDYRLADGADGLDVALRLRARFAPDLPLLLVTGETAPERLQRVHDSGVPVLFKPVAANVLLEALADLTKTLSIK